MYSAEMPETNTRRMLWRCRRGLLELDIVLERFVKHDFASMTKAQLTTFERLLDYPDNELWDMVTGRVDIQDASALTLLEEIRSMKSNQEKEGQVK